ASFGESIFLEQWRRTPPKDVNAMDVRVINGIVPASLDKNGHWECRSMREHIPIDRAWILIQEASVLSAKEAEHLEKCSDCKQFLQSFMSVARYIGLSVDFPTRHRLDHEDVA